MKLLETLLLVGSLERNDLVDAKRIDDSRYVSKNPDVLARGKVAPDLPVVLSKGSFQGNNEVTLAKHLVHVGELPVRNPLGSVAVGALEVKIVLTASSFAGIWRN